MIVIFRVKALDLFLSALGDAVLLMVVVGTVAPHVVVLRVDVLVDDLLLMIVVNIVALVVVLRGKVLVDHLLLMIVVKVVAPVVVLRSLCHPASFEIVLPRGEVWDISMSLQHDAGNHWVVPDLEAIQKEHCSIR
jgi:hypothetical protein